jgi:multidrug efflux system membrane fusion protein
VKTGPTVDDTISITSGLDVGEEVVTEGGDRLVDGAKVRLPSDIPAEGQGGEASKAAESGAAGRRYRQRS